MYLCWSFKVLLYYSVIFSTFLPDVNNKKTELLLTVLLLKCFVHLISDDVWKISRKGKSEFFKSVSVSKYQSEKDFLPNSYTIT